MPSAFRRPPYHLPENIPLNWFSRGLERTLNEGYSLTIVIVGKRTGIGKTWACLRLAELFDPEGFKAKDVEEGKYCFYAKDYISSVRNSAPYRWHIFDEPGRKGSGGAKQEWQTEVNKAMASTAQISRFMLPVSVFIVPHRLFIASSLLGLAQLLMVLDGRGSIKVYHVEVSEFDGNIYTPLLGHIKIDQLPEHDLLVAAEDRKKAMWHIDTSKWISDIDKMDRNQKTSYDVAQEIISQGKIPEVSTDRLGVQVINPARIGLYAKCGKTKALEIRQYLQLEQEKT